MSSPPAWMDALRLTVLRAELRPETPWHHDEPALALRGALGNAMVRLLCTREQTACDGCSRQPSCLFPGWYDPARGGAQRSRPFWLRTRGAGDGSISPERPLELLWTFLGEIPRASLPIEALHSAAAVGLGPERIPHEVRLSWAGPSGWSESGQPEPVPLSVLVGSVPPADRPLLVSTISRLRLRRNGRFLRRPLVSDLLRALVFRVRSLERSLGLRGEVVWPEPDIEEPPVRWRWGTGGRFSPRERQDVDLSGVNATWRIGRGEAAAHRDLLAAAEWLQVGAGTSTGLGVLRLMEPEAAKTDDTAGW